MVTANDLQIRFDQFSAWPESLIDLAGEELENVSSFRYLGTIIEIASVWTSEKELSHRIALANGKFSSMKSLLRNYRLDLDIRVRLYEVYVRSRLCYLAETWNLTQVGRMFDVAEACPHWDGKKVESEWNCACQGGETGW